MNCFESPTNLILSFLPSRDKIRLPKKASGTLTAVSGVRDFASRREIDVTIDDDWNDEPRGKRGAIARAILLRGVNRCAKFRSIERIKHSWFRIAAIPYH